MPDPIADHDLSLATLAADQRPRLVNLCAYITGQREAAEDLAQETLLEAWRNRSKLSSLPGAAKWLSVVARHVCLRWLRAEGRRAPGRLETGDALEPELDLEDFPADALNLEIELERDELAELLDRALAQLPTATRTALIHKYVLELPQAEIAARLGLSEGAVEARLQRGKLSLHRLLQTDLRPQADAFGLCAGPADRWQLTRLWCPICGRHKFHGQLPRDGQDFQLHCPQCSWQPNAYFAQTQRLPEFEGVRSFKATLNRFMAYMHGYLQPGLRGGRLACRRCGQFLRLNRELPSQVPTYPGFGRRGVSLKCPACGLASHADIYGLALDTPAAIKFWRDQRRISTQPEQALEVDGRPAWQVRFQSQTTAAQLSVMLAQESYAVLGVYAENGGH